MMVNKIHFYNCYFALLLIVFISCGQNQNTNNDHNRVLAHEDTLPLSPTKPDVKTQNLNTVEGIQQAYLSIISLYENSALDSISFKYNCNGERSGTVSYFSAKGELKMIRHRYAEYDHHEMTDNYYINNNLPFFAYLKTLSWSFDDVEGQTKDRITERRIYLSNWKSIKCLEKIYEVGLHAGINPKPQDIANKEINCSSFKPIEKSYRILAKYWKTTAPKCLEN